MATKCACIFICFIAAVVAQIPSLGFCPSYTPMEDFDMERFLGKWYEAERYFTLADIGSRCVITDYAKSGSGRIYVSNEYTNRITGVKRVVNGNLEQSGREGEGKLQVKYQAPLAGETNLVVLDTDYDEYAVVWSCSGLGPFHAENAWIMTRERLPPGSVLQKAYGVLDRYRISHTFFMKTDQEGCALGASDINAAQGISSTSTVAQQLGEEQKSAKKKTEQPVKSSIKNIAPEEIDVTEEIIEEGSEKVAAVPVPQYISKAENEEELAKKSDEVDSEKPVKET